MTEDFFNSRIDVHDLPQLPSDSFEPLAPAYLRSKYVADAVTAAIVVVLALMATAAVRAADGPVWVPLAAAVVMLALIGLTAILQTVSVRHLGYLVREHDLSLRQGVIVRVTSTIPYNRVQHVGVDRGPIERLYGLATLQLRSAGGVIGISGLTTADANRLKELVAARAGMDDAGRTATTGDAAPAAAAPTTGPPPPPPTADPASTTPPTTPPPPAPPTADPASTTPPTSPPPPATGEHPWTRPGD